jgi:hypothetical protein
VRNQSEQWRSRPRFAGTWRGHRNQIELLKDGMMETYNLMQIGSLYYYIGNNEDSVLLSNIVKDYINKEPLIQNLYKQERDSRTAQSIRRIEYFLIRDQLCHFNVLIEVPDEIIALNKLNFYLLDIKKPKYKKSDH